MLNMIGIIEERDNDMSLVLNMAAHLNFASFLYGNDRQLESMGYRQVYDINGLDNVLDGNILFLNGRRVYEIWAYIDESLPNFLDMTLIIKTYETKLEKYHATNI